MTTKETRQVSIPLPERYWEEIDALAGGREFFEKILPVVIMRGLSVGEWSNNAALGYLLMAAEEIGMDPEQTYDLLRAMYRQFDFKSQKEAENAYRAWRNP